ncbi:MAG: hypothetical protein ACJ8LI_06695 [Chthoniobacterales bacterium]
MRARPREINIFNMSLLDILCGALGAFCFMMLVALPYYVAGKEDRVKSQQRTEELMKDVEQLRQRMTDPAQAEELRKLIDELEAQIKRLQGELNQYTYENEQLKQENTRLADENTRLTTDNQNLQQQLAQLQQEKAQLVSEKTQLQDANDRLTAENELNKKTLQMAHPFVVMAGAADPSQDLALFLEDQKLLGGTDKKGFANVQFEPDTINQNSGWGGDLTNFGAEGRGVTLWVSAGTVADSSYRVFVKYRRTGVDNGMPFSRNNLKHTPVFITCFGDFEGNRKAAVVLMPEQPWVLVGTLNIDGQGKMNLKEATAEERDQAWRALMKEGAGPTRVPTATPGGTLSPEDMERIRKKSEELRRQSEETRRGREGASPAASATPESGSDMAARALRLRSEREAQSPTPTPAGSP